MFVFYIGPGDGSRLAIPLRHFLGELGMITPGFIFVNAAFNVPFTPAYTEDGTPTPSNDKAESKGERLVSELEWYAKALKTHTRKYRHPICGD